RRRRRERLGSRAMKPTLRDLLFGDRPLSEWARDGEARGEPWARFARAQAALDRGDTTAASELLLEITRTEGLEPRHHLEAWHALRALGVSPPEERGKDVLGVVVEVGLELGLDILAVYRDHSARYYNQAGGGEVWERPDDSLDRAIDLVLEAG